MKPREIWPATLCGGIALAALALLAGCDELGPIATESNDHRVETFVGIPPVAYLVDRIGGPYVRVAVLVQPGQDPHTFEPTPRQVMSLGKARLFFKIGMPFEDRLIERIAAHHSHMTIVDTTAGIAKRASEHECEHQRHDEHCEHDQEAHGEHCEHDDEAHGEHDHPTGSLDPHVWLAPPLLKQMAATITAALVQADPQHEDAFRANLAALNAELDALHANIAQALSPYRGQAFYVFHPAFGYFADTYGLKQESVEVEGKSPTPRQLYRLIGQARADRVKIIFLQPQFDQHTATAVAHAIDGSVVPMDSMARDVVANLNDMARKIAASRKG